MLRFDSADSGLLIGNGLTVHRSVEIFLKKLSIGGHWDFSSFNRHFPTAFCTNYSIESTMSIPFFKSRHISEDGEKRRELFVLENQ